MSEKDEIIDLKHKLAEAQTKVKSLQDDVNRLIPFAVPANIIIAANIETAWKEWVVGKNGKTVQAHSVPKFIWQSGYASGTVAALKAALAIAHEEKPHMDKWSSYNASYDEDNAKWDVCDRIEKLIQDILKRYA